MSTPAVSTVPAVKTWLFQQMRANLQPAAGVDMLIRWGDPGPYDPQDVVSLQTTSRRAVPFAMTGSETAMFSFKETYTINVQVDVMRPGGNADQPGEVADTQAWAYVSQVENIVRADPTAGGNLVVAKLGSSRDSSKWDDNHKFYAVTVTLAIDCVAFI